MIRLKLTASAAVTMLVLSGCGQKPRPTDPPAMSGAELSNETQRCAHGGADAAKDPGCRAVRDENFDRFIGKDPKK
jgi:conjugative transfer region protein TrbK